MPCTSWVYHTPTGYRCTRQEGHASLLLMGQLVEVVSHSNVPLCTAPQALHGVSQEQYAFLEATSFSWRAPFRRFLVFLSSRIQIVCYPSGQYCCFSRNFKCFIFALGFRLINFVSLALRLILKLATRCICRNTLGHTTIVEI